MATVLRDVVDSDLRLLAELDQAMCSELAEADKLPPPAFGLQWFTNHCSPGRKGYQHWKAFAACVKDRPQGFIVFHVRDAGRKKWPRNSWQHQPSVELFWLMVAPDSRSKGVGRLLVEHLLSHARQFWPVGVPRCTRPHGPAWQPDRRNVRRHTGRRLTPGRVRGRHTGRSARRCGCTC